MRNAKPWDDTDISGSAVSAPIGGAVGGPTNWLVGLSGNWEDAFNWSDGVPNSSSTVTIGAPGTYTVTLSTAGTADTFAFDAAGATSLRPLPAR